VILTPTENKHMSAAEESVTLRALMLSLVSLGLRARKYFPSKKKGGSSGFGRSPPRLGSRIARYEVSILKILLTGEIGAGKTTICEKIVEGARKRGIACTGILTRNLKENGNVVLQIEELSSGEKRLMAQKSEDGKALRGIHYCKYVFDEDTIKFAKKALLKRADLLLIDEVGPLELGGKVFSNAFKEFEATENRHAIIVTRIETKDQVAKRLKTDYSTYEVTEKNRNELPEIILSRLIGQ